MYPEPLEQAPIATWCLILKRWYKIMPSPDPLSFNLYCGSSVIQTHKWNENRNGCWVASRRSYCTNAVQ